MDVTCYKGKQLTLYITKTTQLPDSIMLAGNANHILFFFFFFFILIIIIKVNILRTIFLLFACSEAELRLTVITVQNDLL